MMLHPSAACRGQTLRRLCSCMGAWKSSPAWRHWSGSRPWK